MNVQISVFFAAQYVVTVWILLRVMRFFVQHSAPRWVGDDRKTNMQERLSTAQTDNLPRSGGAKPGVKYAVHTMLLREMLEHVRSFDQGGVRFREVFNFVCGLRIGETCVLTGIIPVEYDLQTSGRVEINDCSSIRQFAALDQVGGLVVAHYHSHPSKGVGGTRPSSTDEAFQSRLESGNPNAIGLVFSRDGYVRFFRSEADFTVVVQGNGVQEVEANVFLVQREMPLVKQKGWSQDVRK